MFTKLLNVLLIYLGDKFSPRSQAQKSLTSFGMEKLRVIVGVIAAVALALICFSQAVYFMLDDLRTFYHSEGTLGLSVLSFIPGGILLAVGVILFFAFRDKTWGVEQKKEVEVKSLGSEFQPLVETINAILVDMIEERKKDREHRRELQAQKHRLREERRREIPATESRSISQTDVMHDF